MSNETVLDFMAQRQSIPLSMFREPGPDDKTLARLLSIALRVPDHGRLEPWRLVTYRPEHAMAIGAKLAERAVAMRGPLGDADLEREKNRLNRAPLAIGVVSAVDTSSHIPEWEQFLSAGAVCMNLVTAATAAGFAANWVTGWYSDDAQGRAILGLEPHERMAGIVHIGSTDAKIPERPRPDATAKVSDYAGPAPMTAPQEA
ncbi:MAG: nitroreductase [Pseudomonadota bacterium]